MIPRSKIHVVPVPETLVRIEPEWRGFEYFMIGNQMVIVDPGSMEIVGVLDV